MNLELKHLAAYLPYDLKIKLLKDFIYPWQITVEKHKTTSSHPQYLKGDIIILDAHILSEYIAVKENEFKPIFRPLSDLTKEIEHNRERFVPIVELAKKISFYEIETIESYSKSEAVIYFIDSKGFKRGVDIVLSPEGYLQYNFYTRNEKWAEDWSSLRIDHLSVTDKLLEWHFDVFGLIDAGLAIDINTTPHN